MTPFIQQDFGLQRNITTRKERIMDCVLTAANRAFSLLVCAGLLWILPHSAQAGPCYGLDPCDSNCPASNCCGDCDDHNSNTIDTCNPATGQCDHELIQCDDNDDCTDDRVIEGACVHTQKLCSPNCPGYLGLLCDPCWNNGGGLCSPDCENSYDPCKQECPAFSPCLDLGCKAECGGSPCSKEDQFTYCDNPNDPCQGGCGPRDPSGSGCTFQPCMSRAGDATPTPGSVKVSWGLGQLPGGYTAPTLWLHRRLPSPTLFKPEGLRISYRKAEDPAGLWGFSYVAGMEILPYEDAVPVRQVSTPQAFVDITPDPENSLRYYLRFYRNKSGWVKSGPVYVVAPGASPVPFTTWIVENPNPTTYNNLRIRQISPTGEQLVQYDYIYESAFSSWTLITSDPTDLDLQG